MRASRQEFHEWKSKRAPIIDEFRLRRRSRCPLVAHGFDFSNGESAVAQIGRARCRAWCSSFCKAGVCSGGARTRASRGTPVDAIIGEEHELDLIGRGRQADLRLVAEPAPRVSKTKTRTRATATSYCRFAFVGPEKRPGENPLQAGHINPPGCH